MTQIPQQLIKKIQQNNLVIFTGAGISINSGLPNWNHLIEKMLDELGSKEEKSEKFKLGLKDELFTPIEILNKKYNRNDLIKVCYINGEISENKFKKIEKDII